MPLTPGSAFGPYKVVEVLGQGGMSSVYRAWEEALEREVALKVLPAQFLHDPTFSERFQREAKVVARLEHPNIVPIHAFGVDEDMPWMAMRLVSGESAASLRAAGPLTQERVVEILRDVAEAIDYAHTRSVLHRDVKPQNILLDEGGHAYLADFGIARIVAGDDQATQTGAVMGTPKYMSPEQARGEEIDHRCDIYSLGVVAYEMFTGSAPFSGTTPMNIAVKHIMNPVPAPDPELLPAALAGPVLKCLAKQADQRYDSAVEFVEALRRGLQDPKRSPADSRAKPQPAAAASTAPPAPTRSPPPPRAPTPARPIDRSGTRPVTRPVPVGKQARSSRRPLLLVAGGAAGLALLVAAAFAMLRPRPADTEVREAAAAEATPTPPAAPSEQPSPVPETGGAAVSPRTSAATLALFEQVCAEGEAASCERLALAYREEGRSPDERDRAPELLGKACEGGRAGACALLGDLYRRGDGVLPNTARAVALYDQGCEHGSVQACYQLGLLYQAGRGVSADDGRARELLQKACDNGLAEACASVGSGG